MNPRGMLIAALFAGLGCCWAQATEPANKNLNAQARRVLAYLEGIYGKQVLCGYNVYVHTPDDFQQTGKQAAIWGRDIRYLRDPGELARHVRRHGYILTLHWHWFFDGDSAWTKRRKTPVDVGRVVTPGTPEHRKALEEMAVAADKLQVLEDAGIPVLWRPLHEIDGGWFWWTDRDRPENTAKLWRMMFDYFTGQRKLDNLIWVYSAGVGSREKKPVEYRRRFYPGPEYVDISGIDIYGVDVQNDVDTYREYFDLMSQVSPGKMLACCECDAVPSPEKMQAGTTPKWLYAMPWWGCPSRRRSVRWATHTMRHELITTLDELPDLGQGDVVPCVGIVEPRDDGSAWFVDRAPTIRAYAVDRGGRVDRVEFYANERMIGSLDKPPYDFVWQNAPAGCYDLTAVAVDQSGQKNTSNRIHLAVGMVDLARGKPVTASGGDHPEQAVDGNYYTSWSATKGDQAWITVDLGRVHEIGQVNLVWGWKIHPSHFVLEVAVDAPQSPGSWTTVHSAEDLPWVTWKATHRVRFPSTRARYVRLRATKRIRNQTWGGYQLAALEIPVPVRK